MTEIQVISDIEHENLVKLYGCCVEANQRILVYNYLENNSLAQTLLGMAAYLVFISCFLVRDMKFSEIHQGVFLWLFFLVTLQYFI